MLWQNKHEFSYTLRPCLQGERVTLASGQGRVTRVGGLPYLRARVTLASGLTFSLVNTPGRVNPPTRGNFLLFPDRLSATAY